MRVLAAIYISTRYLAHSCWRRSMRCYHKDDMLALLQSSVLRDNKIENFDF